MKIEYEATFFDIDKNQIREKLKNIGAGLVKEEFIQSRKIFALPDGDDNGFIRVRNEGDRNTITLKRFLKNNNIDDQKEVEIVVNDFDNSLIILKELGLDEEAYQETKREIWEKDGVEIMIDTWPFLEPFIEIEGKNELEVKKISGLLDFDWKDAIFGPVTILYKKKYGLSEDIINKKTPKIIFDMENPFLNRKDDEDNDDFLIDLEEFTIDNQDSYEIRYSARGIIFNNENKIAFINAKTYGYHLFPGGGIEEGENIEEALEREVKEEIGVDVEIEKEFFRVKEIRRSQRQILYSYYYTGKVVNDKGDEARKLEEHEILAGFETEWMTIDEAIEILKEEGYSSILDKYSYLRNLEVLEILKN